MLQAMPDSRAEPARLFLALWPDDAVQRALASAAARWQWPRGARRIADDRLHVTLHFLGDVPRARVDELGRALRVPFSPCTLVFGCAELWPRGLAVLRPHRTPNELVALHQRLGEALQAEGVETERREWKAHVTLARDARGALPEAVTPEFAWPVDGYALVESARRPPLGYRILRDYRHASARAGDAAP